MGDVTVTQTVCSHLTGRWERQAAWQTQVLTSQAAVSGGAGINFFGTLCVSKLMPTVCSIEFTAAVPGTGTYKDNLQVLTGPFNVPVTPSLPGELGFLIPYIKENDSNA